MLWRRDAGNIKRRDRYSSVDLYVESTRTNKDELHRDTQVNAKGKVKGKRDEGR